MPESSSVAEPMIAQAVQQVRNAVGVIRLPQYGVLEISGPDAARFLQNRLSNDVLALQAGQGQLNAALDRQGKIEGVFSLHRLDADSFWLIVFQPELESTVQGIEKYHILEQLTLSDKTEDLAVLACQGPKSAPLLAKLLPDVPGWEAMPEWGLRQCPWAQTSLTVIRRSLTGESGYLLILPAGQAEGLWGRLQQTARELGGGETSPEAWETLRIEAGQPLFGKDYTTQTLLPETGLERQAVSYGKGCYLGQETVARIRTYGLLPKALTGLLFEPGDPVPEPGGECRLDGRSVGSITSAAYSPTLERPIAMAYLGKAERVPGKPLQLEINQRHYQVTVALLPFYDGRSGLESGEELLAEGLKLFSDGYDEEAIRLLQNAIEKQPDLIEAYEALGVILSRHDRFDEAIELMHRVLDLDPDHVLAHTNLSVFYMKLGDKDKAEEEKAKATMAAFSKKAKESGLRFDPEAERRKQEQALLDRAAMFEEALKFNPDDPLGNFGLGSAYLELKRYEDAIAPLEKTLQAQPRHSVAYLSLGKAWEGAHNLERAEETYRKGIEVAAAKGDLMPLKEMQARLEQLSS